MPIDRRRFYPIEVEQINDRTFHLKIGNVMWSEVEWSPSRRVWCIQDSQGHCLLHCEHIVGTNIDQRTAIATAKAMIRDGRMPSPEEARAARDIRSAQKRELADALEADGEKLRELTGENHGPWTPEEYLGEPMEILEEEKVPVRK
jgi:hypothetical protein